MASSNPRVLRAGPMEDTSGWVEGAVKDRFGTLLVLLAAMTAAVPARSSDSPASPAPPVKPGTVVWTEPTRAVLVPQTDAEKAAGQEAGRPLPQPELLQPELDPALAPYVPTPGLTISRSFKVGSSDVLPGLVQAWAKAFQAYHPGFSLEIVKPYAGSLGALELIKGNLDFVFVSRELKPSDISGFKDKFGYEPFSVPISGGSWRQFGFLDSVGFIVHPDNPIRQLSFAQLDALFSAGHLRGGRAIRTWGDLGLTGAWAKRPVTLYGIAPWNGYEEFVRQRVLSTPGHRGEWRQGIHYDPTFYLLARRVAADKGAIGYTGLSAIDSEVKMVPVSVDAAGPFLTPSYENVANASYPLARVTYLNANARSGADLDPALREFLRFILSREGQAVVRQQGIYLPLRAGQIEASQRYVASR